jgi:hypothetical protein
MVLINYQKTNVDRACLHMPVIPAIWKAEIGGSRFEECPEQKWEILSEKQI